MSLPHSHVKAIAIAMCTPRGDDATLILSNILTRSTLKLDLGAIVHLPRILKAMTLEACIALEARPVTVASRRRLRRRKKGGGHVE
jgi:hypothetical protein